MKALTKLVKDLTEEGYNVKVEVVLDANGRFEARVVSTDDSPGMPLLDSQGNMYLVAHEDTLEEALRSLNQLEQDAQAGGPFPIDPYPYPLMKG